MRKILFAFLLLLKKTNCAYAFDDPNQYFENFSEQSLMSRPVSEVKAERYFNFLRDFINSDDSNELVDFIEDHANQEQIVELGNFVKSCIVFEKTYDELHIKFSSFTQKKRPTDPVPSNIRNIEISGDLDNNTLSFLKKLRCSIISVELSDNSNSNFKLLEILEVFDPIMELTLDAMTISRMVIDKIASMSIPSVHINISGIGLSGLQRLLGMRSIEKCLNLGNCVQNFGEFTSRLFLNRECRKLSLKALDGMYPVHQSTLSSIPQTSRGIIAEIILQNLYSEANTGFVELDLDTLLFIPICPGKTNIAHLVLNFTSEYAIENILRQCLTLNALEINLGKVMRDFSFLNFENLHDTVAILKITVLEAVSDKPQNLTKILKKFKKLNMFRKDINYLEDVDCTFDLSELSSDLEYFSIDSNSLKAQTFHNPATNKEISEVNLNWCENPEADVLAMFMNLRTKTNLKTFIMKELTSFELWNALENYENLRGIRIKNPISFPLVTTPGSRLSQTLNVLLINVDVSVIQGVILALENLHFLHLILSSDIEGDSSSFASDQKIVKFLDNNFRTALNWKLVAFTLDVCVDFDVMALTRYTFVSLTEIHLFIAAFYSKEEERQFIRIFDERLRDKASQLVSSSFSFKASKRKYSMRCNEV